MRAIAAAMALVVFGCGSARAEQILTPDQVKAVPGTQMRDPDKSQAARLDLAAQSARALERSMNQAREASWCEAMQIGTGPGTLANPAASQQARVRGANGKPDLLANLMSAEPSAPQAKKKDCRASQMSGDLNPAHFNADLPNGAFREPACNPRTAPGGAC